MKEYYNFSILLNYSLILFIFLFSFISLLLIRSIALRIFKKLKEKTSTKIYELIFHTIKTPSIFWILAISVYIAISLSNLDQRYINFWGKIIYVIVIFSVTYTIANLIEQLIKNYVYELKLPFTPTGIVYGVIKGIVFIIGFLVILSVLDISIAPFITSLGIGGLAVALALQDTLSNLFAGIHILIEKSIRVGDFVRLENGQEGYVEEIGWRTTKIRMISNNIIIIPNNKLSQSIVTNYSLIEKRTAVFIPISVSYDTDIDKLEKIVLEEAELATKELEGLLDDPKPVLRFNPGFGESSLNFTLVCHVREFTDQFIIQHELRKRIFKRFKQEGIEIPFPQRVVHIKNNYNQSINRQ